VRNPNAEVWNFAYLTIATNRYVKYWEEMVESADQRFTATDRVIFQVLTDQPKFCSSVAAKLKNVEVVVTQIETLGWPEATLLRYKLYAEHCSSLPALNFAHVDADMLFIQNPLHFTDPKDWLNGIALVQHPGYFRTPDVHISIQQRIKDLVLTLQNGALGTWETNEKSKAFVSRNKRKNYVCGGSWMGTKASFFKLVETLKDSTESDLQKNFIAKWHDESHINHWASNNPHTLLPPSFCYDISYPWLLGTNEVIRAVRKMASVD